MKYYSFIPLVVILLVEVLLRLQNPYRLWKDAFDESSVCEPDSQRGWKPVPGIGFDFYHRYMKGKREIRLNSLGLRSSKEYSSVKEQDTYRILIFGETTLVGWELEESQTISSMIEKNLSNEISGKKIEIIPVAARNYCLGQLFLWYKTVFHKFDYDLLIYYFNVNNPRRTITFHESGKPILFTKPVFLWSEAEGLRLCGSPQTKHPNDMIYLGPNDNTIIERGRTARTLHMWLRDCIHVYCALVDCFQGATRLRKFNDRTEIKDIEKSTKTKSHGDKILPYQWETCMHILREWSKLVSKKSSPMIIIPHMAYYNAGNNWLLTENKHPLGFKYNEIPCRRYLKYITKKINVEYFDTYQYAYENRVDTRKFYVHPRYAYYNPIGAEFQSKYISKMISSYLPN